MVLEGPLDVDELPLDSVLLPASSRTVRQELQSPAQLAQQGELYARAVPAPRQMANHQLDKLLTPEYIEPVLTQSKNAGSGRPFGSIDR